MDLIKTKRKEKLPKGFSYPMGAEQISFSLQNVPQYAGLELIFQWKDIFWASEYQNKLKTNGQIEILKIYYSSHFDVWRMFIHAVPKEHAQRVRDLIPETVLSKLASILKKTPAKVQYFRWGAIYDLASGSIHINS